MNQPKPSLASTPSTTTVPDVKQSFVSKSKAFVKNHKRPLIAATALVGLVGASAFAGRKTASLETLVYDSDEVEVELKPIDSTKTA